MAGIGAQFQLGHQCGQLKLRARSHLIVDQLRQRGQRLPALAGLGTRGRLGRQSQWFEKFAHYCRQLTVDTAIRSAL